MSWPFFAGDGAGGDSAGGGGDLTSWPRRGTSLYALLTDGAWDYKTFVQILADHGMNLTRFWLLTANWAEQVNDIVWPFAKRADGLWDLDDWDHRYFERLASIVAEMNARGIVPQITIAELYAWCNRKQGLPGVPDANAGPFRHNVNGIRWGADIVGASAQENDDYWFEHQPDAWFTEFIGRAVSAVRGYEVVFELGNEMPEKGLHERLRAVVRGAWPEAQVSVNRGNEAGQYANMGIGHDYDRIAYHGVRDLAGLDAVSDNGDAPDRPDTLRKLIAPWPGTDPTRIVFSSDGARASSDPVNTYDWPRLIEVFDYVWQHGCSIEHQSRAKMTRIQTGKADLGSIEFNFLDQIARL